MGRPERPAASVLRAGNRLPEGSAALERPTRLLGQPASAASTGWQQPVAEDVQLLVVSGAATVELDDGTQARLAAGEAYGVPPGAAHRTTAHRTTARESCELLRFGPAGAVRSDHLTW